jgi:signal transduction histidine kinase
VTCGAVIAAADFHQIAKELEHDLVAAQLKTSGVVASVCLAMFGLLFGIVLRGARTIDRQHWELELELELRRADVARMSEQSAALSLRVQRASLRGAELNERHLRRISAELHHGPAQAPAHASLRLDALFREAPDAAPQEREEIRAPLTKATPEMRKISRRRSLPQIEDKPLREVIAMVARAHERRTGSDVAIDLKCDGCKPGHSTVIVQEGPPNAFRHGGGIGQRVWCEVAGETLTISRSNDGPGFDPGVPSAGLGLPRLRERVESAGGAFALQTTPGAGTRLFMTPGG